MADFNANLWAPWRMEYLRSLADEAEETGCFLCRYRDDPGSDAANHVVWRGRYGLVVMNRFPYTNGHLLVATTAHESDPVRLNDTQAAEITTLTWQSVTLLRKTLNPSGFNVGSNLGHCAGAGVPDHFHCHVVPRWAGDTNYMAVLGNTRVVPDSLDALYDELVSNAVKMGLRERAGAGP